MVNFDSDIIFLTSEMARIKLREISHLLGKSSQRVKYNLKVLESNLIVQPHCIFDYSYFGLLLFRVYFKGAYIAENDKKAIISKLQDNPFIISMYELGGEFDLVFEFLSPNPSRFNKELKKIAHEIPTFSNYKIILNIVTHLYPRTYLLKDDHLPAPYVPLEIVIGGDREVEQFTAEEMSVIHQLLISPKIRLTKLSREVKLNIKTATNLLKTLQKRKIIKGFKYLVDHEKMLVNRSRLFLKCHNLNPDVEKKMRDCFSKTSEIICVNKTVGDWDLEVDIESSDRTRIRYLVAQMREEFKEYISSFNIMEFQKFYKVTYLPRYLFEKE